MKTVFSSSLLAGLFLSSAAAFAAAPADAPAGSMGLCKDGTYSSSAEKKGACRGHKGVKEWYAADASPATAGTAPVPGGPRAADPSAKPSAMPAATAAKPTMPAVAGRTSETPGMAAAPGGGAGQVWANENTKVYHCNGDKFYGKTKKGEYMSEADAKSKGYHADHGKACA